MNLFDGVKERVSIEDVLNDYGVERVGRHYRCPFHNDRHPSLSVRDNSWRCWTCNIGGSVIDFIMHLANMSSYPAAVLLNDKYNLGLVGKKPDANALDDYKKMKQLIAEYETELKDIEIRLCYYARLFNWMRVYFPKGKITRLHKIAWVEKAYLDYILDDLTSDPYGQNLTELREYLDRLEGEVFGKQQRESC